MIRRVADILVRWRPLVLAAWLATALLAAKTGVPSLRRAEPTGLLPASAASREATDALGRYFPVAAGLSQAVVILERTDDPQTPGVETLTAADLAALDRIRRRIVDPVGSPYAKRIDVTQLSVLSPSEIPLLRAAMVSPARESLGQAGLLTVQIPADRIAAWSFDVADHVQYAVSATELPAGLTGWVTGTAAFNRDYALAADRSQQRTLWMAVGAVVLILLIVYRAPLTAGIAIVAVALAAAAATGALAAAAGMGVGVGGVERIFLYVLLFGATVNYSLFYLAGYREGISLGRSAAKAAVDSWLSTAPVIAASAGTTIAGLCTLAVARYGLFRNLAPVAAVALGIALVAALTLVPALAATCGTGVFWPAQRRAPYKQHGPVWPRIGSFVSVRPVLTLVVALGLLGLPALQMSKPTWAYDTLADLAETYPAMQGAERIRRHWSDGELAPVGVLIEAPVAAPTDAFEALSKRLTVQLLAIPGVTDVRSVSAPIGTRADPRFAPGGQSVLEDLGEVFTDPFKGLRQIGIDAAARKSYIRPRAMRMELVMAPYMFSDEAIATVNAARKTIAESLAGTPLAGSRIHLAGITAEMMDIRTLTQSDFRRVAIAALLVILLIAVALVHDLWLAMIMVGGTVLGYLAAMGLTLWVFTSFGATGIDWKVGVFLFVVMVAVGQDYNIFLVARLATEGRAIPPRRAARRAIVATGGIISTCGLIMAATLGSLMAGDLDVLVQLGFALAAGMVIHTFAICPLLTPALAIITRRTGKPIC